MNLKEELFNDLKEAMKDKDVVRKDTIQIVRAAVLQIEKDSKITADDSIVLNCITKEVKKRKDVLPDYEKSGRLEAIADIHRQIEILQSYLPQQLSENELLEIVHKSISAIGAAGMKDMGKVMAEINPQVSGRADSKTVADIVKKELSNL